MFARKEVKCLLWTDQKSDTCDEENISKCEQCAIEKEDDAEEEKEDTKGDEGGADLWQKREANGDSVNCMR